MDLGSPYPESRRPLCISPIYICIKAVLAVNMDRKQAKIRKKIRNMSWHQKLILMDWLNMWYEAYKEGARIEFEAWGEEE